MNSTVPRSAGGAASGTRAKGNPFRTFGDKSGYESTIKMQFRGQDKKKKDQLGLNPNQNFNQSEEDEYIQNLYQQIHFMDLELKILKDKVIEDEKKSGIGSLYDDDKSSHQHINFLRTKYAQMRRDADRKFKEYRKRNLKNKGQEFMLEATMSVIKQQSQKLQKEQQEYNENYTNSSYKLEKEVMESTKQLNTLQAETSSIKDQHDQSELVFNKNALNRKVTESLDIALAERHELEKAELEKLVQKRRGEEVKVDADLKKIEQDFQNHKEYQKAIQETARLRAEIEEKAVKQQFLEMEANLLEELVIQLKDKKDELTEQKKVADEKHETLKQSLKTQQATTEKRIMAKMNRDKSVHHKELISNRDFIKETSSDVQQKLATKMEECNKLEESKIEIQEELRLRIIELEEDTKTVEAQEKVLEGLKADISSKSTTLEDLNKRVDDGTKINKTEELDNRNKQQDFTAYNAKLEFIEAKYDYCKDVNELKLDVFKNVIESNVEVNQAVDDFMKSVVNVKDEVKQIINQRQVY